MRNEEEIVMIEEDTMEREEMYAAMAEIEEARQLDIASAAIGSALNGGSVGASGFVGVGVSNTTYPFHSILSPVQLFNVNDPTVMKVLRKFESRHQAGMATYGVSLHDNSSDLEFWLNSAMEEAMDLTLYLQRTLEEIKKMKENSCSACPMGGC